MSTVLLVEDNQKLNEINRRALEKQGLTVLTAATLAEARQHLQSRPADVILLDVMLPDGDGIAFCAEIRAQSDAHILFLTSRAEHADRIRGLDSGGDDYITKPYKLEEMLSRVRAALRRRNMGKTRPPERLLVRGGLSLDVVASQAFLAGQDLLLTPKEFALLLLLLQNYGQTLRKEALYEAAWRQPLAGDAGALWTQISLLKKKLEEASGGAITLFASRGEGYRLEME